MRSQVQGSYARPSSRPCSVKASQFSHCVEPEWLPAVDWPGEGFEQDSPSVLLLTSRSIHSLTLSRSSVVIYISYFISACCKKYQN